MVARREVDEGPEEFRRALAVLRAASPRAEIVLSETPAPTRLAPHASALTADVLVDDEEEDEDDSDDEELEEEPLEDEESDDEEPPERLSVR